uniref:Uncharacterized protein n=1 Tax=Anguilla anguilla TaxID=7936 RepID=A0A0E9Q4U4_ANGAN
MLMSLLKSSMWIVPVSTTPSPPITLSSLVCLCSA